MNRLPVWENRSVLSSIIGLPVLNFGQKLQLFFFSSPQAFSSICFISGTSAVWNCSVSLSSCVINTEVIQLRRLHYKCFYHLFERVLYRLPVVAIRLQSRRHGSVLSTLYWHEPTVCKFCTSFTSETRTEKQLLFSVKLGGGGLIFYGCMVLPRQQRLD